MAPARSRTFIWRWACDAGSRTFTSAALGSLFVAGLAGPSVFQTRRSDWQTMCSSSRRFSSAAHAGRARRSCVISHLCPISLRVARIVKIIRAGSGPDQARIRRISPNQARTRPDQAPIAPEGLARPHNSISHESSKHASSFTLPSPHSRRSTIARPRTAERAGRPLWQAHHGNALFGQGVASFPIVTCNNPSKPLGRKPRQEVRGLPQLDSGFALIEIDLIICSAGARRLPPCHYKLHRARPVLREVPQV